MYAAALLSDEADLAYASATDVAAAIRARRISPVEAVQAAARRIEARDPTLNAFVFLAIDEALEQARAAEKALMSGEAIGPLHGVPTAMKDLFDFKPGWPSTFGGVPALASFTPDFSCSWVERMEAAGAIVLGKTNSPVFGFSGVCDNGLFGPTGNPFAPARNSGGSSGGAPPPSRTGWWRSRRPPTAAGRRGSPRRGAGSSGSSSRWAGCRSSCARTSSVPRRSCSRGSWPGRSRTSRSG